MLSQAPLQGQCIWITRPSHQAIDLKYKIIKSGGQYIHAPTMTIDWLACTITPPPSDKALYAIFTSSNAVPSATQALKQLQASTTNLAIGPATAKALQDHGLDVHCCAPAPFGTQALLSVPLWASLTPKHSHILVFTGLDCSQTLTQALTERHLQAHTHACYQRSCPDTTIEHLLTPAQCQQITTIVSTSADVLNNLWHMTPAKDQTWLRQKTLLVINGAMAQQAKKLGFANICQADNASTDAIMACLTQLNAKQHNQSSTTQTS